MRKGFTLIELLVVIAIIVILLAILSPILGRGCNKARKKSVLDTQPRITSGARKVDDSDRIYQNDGPPALRR